MSIYVISLNINKLGKVYLQKSTECLDVRTVPTKFFLCNNFQLDEKNHNIGRKWKEKG